MSKRRTTKASRTEPVHSITSTQAPLGQDIDRRARRYLAQMLVRTVCFLGAVLTWGRVPSWLSLTLLVGAVVLPYIAVVLANAGRERPERADSLLVLRELGGPPSARPVDPVSVPYMPPAQGAHRTRTTVPDPGGARAHDRDGSVRD